LTALRTAGVKLFYSFYQDKKLLSKKEKQSLRELMSQQLNSILTSIREEPDEELTAIFEAVEGVSYQEAVNNDFEDLKGELAGMLEELGVELNLDNLHANMTEEEIARQMFGLMDDIKEQFETQEATRPQRKKTKKQLAQEERERHVEEAKNKSIATIYKQLARTFHPDLEQDPALKVQKEDLMKQLTTAYEKGDLHTLLRLELEWIQKEENNLEQLSAEKLSIYNQMLKEQVAELQMDIEMTEGHPRYLPLQRYLPYPGMSVTQVDLAGEKEQLEWLAADLEQSLDNMKGPRAVQEIKRIIKDFRRPKPNLNQFMLDLDDIFFR
jgi:hypothetical protein